MITAIILTALFVNGLQVVTNPGMVLDFAKRWIEKILVKPEVRWHQADGQYYNYYDNFRPLYKPLIGCAPCMCSIYGTAITLLTMPFTVDLIWQLPIILISSSALAKLLNSYLI